MQERQRVTTENVVINRRQEALVSPHLAAISVWQSDAARFKGQLARAGMQRAPIEGLTGRIEQVLAEVQEHRRRFDEAMTGKSRVGRVSDVASALDGLVRTLKSCAEASQQLDFNHSRR